MAAINKKISVFIIDGHNMFRRVFSAIKEKGDENSMERAISAANSTVDGIIKDIRLIKPTHVVVVFEGDNGWREKYYPLYKIDKETGRRREMTDMMKLSLKQIKETLLKRGLLTISKDGFEADDLIGSLSTKLTALGIYHTIGSNDKDMFQLVCRVCNCYDRTKKSIVDEGAILEKFGVTPSQMVDYLCMVGDPADNVTGVKGIGDKKAAMLLNKYGTLDAIFENAAEIGGKMGEELEKEETRVHVEMIRKMIDIKVELELGFKLSEIVVSESVLNRQQPPVSAYGYS